MLETKFGISSPYFCCLVSLSSLSADSDSPCGLGIIGVPGPGGPAEPGGPYRTEQYHNTVSCKPTVATTKALKRSSLSSRCKVMYIAQDEKD